MFVKEMDRSKMKVSLIMENRNRIQEIEDRKIAILMEIATINKKYGEQVSRLNSEYERLHRELYMLQMDMISMKNDVQRRE